jgi:hypothetical protein
MIIVCRAPGGVSLIVAEREHLAGHIEVEEYYDLPGPQGLSHGAGPAGGCPGAEVELPPSHSG